jgi:hypothetical protein
MLEPFGTEVPEQSHMEQRFDPVTGKKQRKKEKVVDSYAHTEYSFEGKVLQDDDGLSAEEQVASLIARKAKCKYWQYGFLNQGHIWYVFGPEVKSYGRDDGFEDTYLSAEGDIEFAQIQHAAKQFKRIKAVLKKLGLKPGTAKIVQCFDIS